MGDRFRNTVSATGILTDPGSSNPYFVLGEPDDYVFIGLNPPATGTAYTSLTLQIQGTRTGSAWYDVATYTTDMAGPLAGPLAPTDGSSVAYIGDVRAFNQVRINILTITGSALVEVLTGNFFPLGSQPNNSAQVVYCLRYLAAILSGWLGPPNGPLPALPPAVIGTQPGGSFTGGE